MNGELPVFLILPEHTRDRETLTHTWAKDWLTCRQTGSLCECCGGECRAGHGELTLTRWIPNSATLWNYLGQLKDTCLGRPPKEPGLTALGLLPEHRDFFKALPAILGFPGGSDGKESAWNAGYLGLIPELGWSPGGGNGTPLQYSCLENPMDKGALWAPVHGAPKSWTQLSSQAHIMCPRHFSKQSRHLQYLITSNCQDNP